MQLSLSARILQGGAPPLSAVEFVRLARDTGYDLVELRADQVPADSADPDLAALRRALDRAGLGVSMVVMGGPAPVAAWARVARALGAVNLRAGGTVEHLRALLAELPDDLRLLCQMHSGSPFESVAQAARALAELPDPRLGVMPEPANLLFAGERWSADLLAPLRARLYGCNAQSIALDPASDASVVMNDGRRVPYARLPWPDNRALDFRGFLAALRAVGYDGFVNFIDPFLPGTSVRDLAAATAAYARQCLADLAS